MCVLCMCVDMCVVHVCGHVCGHVCVVHVCGHVCVVHVCMCAMRKCSSDEGYHVRVCLRNILNTKQVYTLLNCCKGQQHLCLITIHNVM